MPKTETNPWVFRLLLLLIAVYTGLFFARPINLATADLGRHIVNGELILNGVYDVLYANHYSFTERYHEFTNHHWGSGVLFYLTHNLFGFEGLSTLYILLSVTALILMIFASKSNSNHNTAALVAISVVPLLAYRVEVRPEGFSYVLLILLYFLLVKFRNSQLNFKKLSVAVLLLQMVWVNMHIFFFLAFIAVGAFWLDAIIQKKTSTIKRLGGLLLGQIAVSLINPHFHKGLLSPLTIFNEYGYMVAENQPIWFMHERFGNSELFHFELFAVITICLFVLIGIRGIWKSVIPELLLCMAFFGLSVLAVRAIPMFALFFIPVAATVISSYVDKLNFNTKQTVGKALPIAGILFLIIFIPLKGTYASAQKGYEKLGLFEEINGAGTFLKRNQIQGKIFNNYDIGSYLIYHLHDREKVFVDNRPEAYSVAFFDSIYKPMQQDDAIWKEKSVEYDINLICFFRLDNTPWAQPFLIRRAQDPDWVPVFVDQVSLILVRNVAENRAVIQKYGIDRSVFKGIPN